MKFNLIILIFISSFSLLGQNKSTGTPNFTCFRKYDDSCLGLKFRYDTEWSLKNPNINLYGKVKKLIELNYLIKNSNSEYQYKTIMLFDLNGYMVSNSSIDKFDKVHNRYQYFYNEHTDLITLLNFSNYDTINCASKHTFYRDQNIVYQTVFNSQDKEMLKVTTYYDSQGYKQKSIMILDGLNRRDTMFYEHDSIGRITKTIEKTNYSGSSETAYLYDTNNNEIGIKNLLNNQISMFESNFDKWGNQLRSNEILEYDENNNWIRRYQIINNHKLLLNERKIEYYLD